MLAKGWRIPNYTSVYMFESTPEATNYIHIKLILCNQLRKLYIFKSTEVILLGGVALVKYIVIETIVRRLI